MRDQGVSDQKLCLSRVGEATAGAGTGGILEVTYHTPLGESGSFSMGLVEMECVLSHFIKVILLGET